MPELVLGPLLRYADETEATIWVETDASCEVEVLGSCSRTFHVEGHHYALVRVSGLNPGDTYESTRSSSTARRSGRSPARLSRRA